jgi:hypothetical protein
VKPTTPPAGSTFYETDTGATYVYDGAAWQLRIESGAGTGFRTTKSITFTGAASLGAIRWLECVLGRRVGGSTGTNLCAALALAHRMHARGEAGSVAPCAPAWPGYDGARVDGGFGTAFHMGIDPSETLHLAGYDFGIYRALPFQCDNVGGGPGPGDLYDGTALTASIGGCDSYDVQGIHLLKFTMPDWVFGNASKSPAEAAAYGINGPSGVLNQSVCEQGAPIFLSHPHFLFASDSVVNGVTGISAPDPQLHGSFFGIDPVR